MYPISGMFHVVSSLFDAMRVQWWVHLVRRSRTVGWSVVDRYGQQLTPHDLLVLSREWMGMGEWDDYYYSDYGSFPHSLLSTSKMMEKIPLSMVKFRVQGCVLEKM